MSVEGKTEQSGEKSQHAYHHYDDSDNTVDNIDAVQIKADSDLIYNIRERAPPQHGSEEDCDEAQRLLPRVLRHNEGKSCEESNEEQYDERVAQSHNKRGYEIVGQSASVV